MLAALAAAVPAYAQVSPLADYVRTRAADADGATDIAVAGYSTALTRNPDDAAIASRAYRVGLSVGDFALVGRAEAVLAKNPDPPIDAAIVRFSIALQSKDRAAAEAAIARMDGGPLGFMTPVLRAWLAFENGEDPFPQLDKAGGDPLSRRFAMEHRALLLIAMKRGGEGFAAVQTMLRQNENDDLRMSAAILLAQTGRKREAMQLLAGDSPEIAALRERLNVKRAKPGAGMGAARLFLSLAIDLTSESDVPGDISILLARCALLLDPTDERPRLYLAEALSREGLNALALGELGKIGTRSPYYRSAFTRKVTILRRAGRTDEALAQAKSLSEGKGATSADARLYGDLLSEAKQYEAAAAAYGVALKRPGGEGDASLHYARGVALDKAGRWGEAEPQLRKALELKPNDAQALHYLGNAIIAHGGDGEAALALLQRANRMRPADPAITDSLGWAYFGRGDMDRALPLLERAAKADPSSTVINEHLGDAYWKLGRRYEARYAWQAAALYADDAANARLKGKIANGL